MVVIFFFFFNFCGKRTANLHLVYSNTFGFDSIRVDLFVKENINVSTSLYAFYFRDIECYLIGLLFFDTLIKPFGISVVSHFLTIKQKISP